MKERLILFSGPMVRAILAGTKTQTRRLVKPQPESQDDNGHAGLIQDCLYGQPGDRLWVKETFCNAGLAGYPPVYLYRADDDIKPPGVKWKPSIFMPRNASRLALEITAIRVERLQDITEADAKAEGAARGCWCRDGVFCEPVDEIDEKMASYKSGYGFLWESINGPGSWNANPWVWVITFNTLPAPSEKAATSKNPDGPL